MKMITVFTPTYNRAYILPQLYKSLCEQTILDFEWVIVDDASSDDTEALVSEWEKRCIFNILYIKYLDGGGKHRAINIGVNKAQGKLFFIVDSDDYLASDALQRIAEQYRLIQNDTSYAGVCGLRCYPDGRVIGRNPAEQDYTLLSCSSLDYRFLYKYKGDRAEVFKTEVLKQYLFPEFEGERFCPEALIWNRISLNYKLQYFWGKIYYCDYLEDGLTAKITKIRMESSQASVLYYSELLNMDIPLVEKCKAAINYWRFYYCIKSKKNYSIPISFKYFCFSPIGLVFHLNDKRKLSK